MARPANYWIMGWDGEKGREGELRTIQENFEESLHSSTGACGDGSSRFRHGMWWWVWGHEVLGRESAEEDGRAIFAIGVRRNSIPDAK